MKIQNCKKMVSTLIAGVVLAGLAGSVSAQTIIYSDGFTGSAGSLNGRAPETRSGTDGGSGSATWVTSGPGTISLTGGGMASIPVVGGGSPSYATLPFVPTSGKVYELTVDLNPINAANSNWLAMGFSSGTTPSIANSVPWMLYREEGDGNAFNQGTSSTFGSFGTVGSTSDPMKITFTLDTTQAAWSATLSVFNLTTQTAVVVGTPTFNYGGSLGIQSVFISAWAGGAGDFDNFSLSVVPEPSTCALLLGGIGIVSVWQGMRNRAGKA
ncbi:MAG: hypothetical protein WC003_13100 [Terrimicrobiaceae bacterium]